MVTRDDVRVSVESGVGVVTIDRPPVNALTAELALRLVSAVESAVNDDGAKSVVLTGGDERFSAGDDIKVLLEKNVSDPASVASVARRKDSLYGRISGVGVPVISAIEGYALGGGLMLTLYCDLRVAAEGAKLGLPEITLGSVPGWGMDRLVNVVGRSRAKYLVMTGTRLSAQRAYEFGLVDEVCRPGNATTRAIELAAEIAKNPVDALGLAKTCIDAIDGMPFERARELGFMVANQIAYSPTRNELLQGFFDRRG